MTNELEKLADKWRNEAAELMSPDEDLRERCEGYNSALVVCARELAALLPSAADGELPELPNPGFLWPQDTGDIPMWSANQMAAYARAAIAASRPSAADEPVAPAGYISETAARWIGEGYATVGAVITRMADTTSNVPVYLRPASARPSAGAGEATVCGYTPGMGRVELQMPGDVPDWMEIGARVSVFAPVAPAADMVLVPREPSEAMLTAMVYAYNQTDEDTAEEDFAIVWRNALAAAQQSGDLA